MNKFFVLLAMLGAACLDSCRSTGHTTKVVKPRYHQTSAKNQWRIDIPVGARHIRLLERKKIKVVKMH
jgi:hypothetical protein